MSINVVREVWELDLPPHEKLLLLAMADHADHEGRNVYPSIDFVAWKTRYSARHVQRLVRGLERRGILVRQGNGNGGRGRSTCYRIDLRKGDKSAPFSRRKDDTAVTVSLENGDADDRKRVTGPAGKGDGDVTRTVKEPTKELNTTTPPEFKAELNGRTELEDRFECFWTAYPKHRDKEAALKEFAKLNPNTVLFNEMLQVLEIQKRSVNWTKNNGCYVPRPLDWLKDEQWMDRLPGPPPRRYRADGLEF